MDTPEPKPASEITNENLKAWLNKGDEERYAGHKYMGQPKKYFWKTIKEKFNIGRDEE